MSAVSPVSGAWPARKYPTCAGTETIPSRSGVTAVRSETMPEPTLERITNRTISLRSSPRGSGAAAGKREKTPTAARPTATEPTIWPITRPITASVTP